MKIPEQLIDIISRGFTLEEVIDLPIGTRTGTGRDVSEDASYLQRKWEHNLATAGKQGFEQRLQWDSIDIESLLFKIYGCKNISDVKATDLPNWVPTFCSVHEFVTLKASDKPSPSLYFDGSILYADTNLTFQVNVPFQDLYSSFLRFARKLVADKVRQCTVFHLVALEAYTALEELLLINLSNLCKYSLWDRFQFFKRQLKKQNIQDSVYDRFIKAIQFDWTDLFEEYPILARTLAVEINNWTTSVIDFFLRLNADRAEIADAFLTPGQALRIVNLTAGIGDPHNNGASPIILELGDGVKVVYKPKDLTLDVAYYRTVEWFNQASDEGAVLKTLHILLQENYGWVEFLPYEPLEDPALLPTFYYKGGVLLALFHLLRVTDCHRENLITSFDQLVPVDLETVCHPDPPGMEHDADSNLHNKAYHTLAHSVLRTGFLPDPRLLSKKISDTSALGGVVNENNPFPTLVWHHLNSDDMQPTFDITKAKLHPNFPLKSFMKIDLKLYAADVAKGFSDAYKLIIKHRAFLSSAQSPLQGLRSCKVRFIFRMTQTYGTFQRNLTLPAFTTNGLLRSLELEKLSLPFLKTTALPPSWPIYRYEVKALNNNDIPYLYARTNRLALYSNGQILVPRYFKKTGFRSVMDNLSKFSIKNLEFELTLLKHTLGLPLYRPQHSLAGKKNKKAIVPFPKAHYLHCAENIATGLLRSAYRGGNGSYSWIGVRYNASMKKKELRSLGFDLYEGVLGPALFFAALHQLTEKPRYLEACQNSLCHLRALLRSGNEHRLTMLTRDIGIGGCSGAGSILYSLVLIAAFLKDKSLLEDALYLIEAIPDAVLLEAKSMDVVDGHAGLILGLCNFYNVTKNPIAITLAQKCADMVVNHQKNTSSTAGAWRNRDGRLLTGFSHGAAGISLALLRLYHITPHSRLKDSAVRATQYEHSLYCREQNNWPDLRKRRGKENKPKFQCSWCHGAPGIGLGRLAASRITQNLDFNADIQNAYRTCKALPLLKMDHLCCGNGGIIDFLIEYGLYEGTLEHTDLIDERLSAIIRKHRLYSGHLENNKEIFYHPQFFQGFSGIGYEILRAVDPCKIPSVLSFNLPLTTE